MDDDDFVVWSIGVSYVFCSNEALTQLEGHTHFVDGSGTCDAVVLCYTSSIDQFLALRSLPGVLGLQNGRDVKRFCTFQNSCVQTMCRMFRLNRRHSQTLCGSHEWLRS